MIRRLSRSPVGRSKALAAAMIAAAFSFAPIVALAADSEVNENRAELRIKELHTRLNILPAQETQWSAVATIMRDNAVRMDQLTQRRVDKASEVTAVEDLKSYGEISEAHAEGIRKLTPAFDSLYSAMSEPQKKQADLLFREGEGAQGGNEAVTQSPTAK
jgi:protein CpxP